MDKAKVAKVLSAAIVANLAGLGLATAPAWASASPAAGSPAHPATRASGASPVDGTPSAGRAHSGLRFIPADDVRTEKLSPQLRNAIAEAARQAKAESRPRGFVPRAAEGASPDTYTGCSGHVCIGVYGAGRDVSYVNTHFWGEGGCRSTYLYFSYGTGVMGTDKYGCYDAKQSHTFYPQTNGQENTFPSPFPANGWICAVWTGINSEACASVYSG